MGAMLITKIIKQEDSLVVALSEADYIERINEEQLNLIQGL